jgi:Eukaryotic cytochrome b561
MEWLGTILNTTLGGSTDHGIAPWAYWHARCMVLAWGVLMPLGALVARFYKVTPSQAWPRDLDNKAWWHAHRGLQWLGIALMALGLWMAWDHPLLATRLARWHAWLGWAVCLLGALQIAGGIARGSKGGPTDAQPRGDHYDMTPWRVAFERLHKSLGWLALLMAIVVIASGLVVADAPRWMALLLAAWWLALVAAFFVLQRAGRCIDTYQAIWGPDAHHPGNRRAPIGWGVRRPIEPKEGA